jgi:hypothetical protein
MSSNQVVPEEGFDIRKQYIASGAAMNVLLKAMWDAGRDWTISCGRVSPPDASVVAAFDEDYQTIVPNTLRTGAITLAGPIPEARR